MSTTHRLRRWYLEISATIQEERGLLRIAGRLGARDAGLLIVAASDAFERGARHLVLDLSGVDYIDSAGATAIDASCGLAAARGGSIVLCAPSAPVRATLVIAPTLLDLDVYETAQEAQAAIERAGVSGSL